MCLQEAQLQICILYTCPFITSQLLDTCSSFLSQMMFPDQQTYPSLGSMISLVLPSRKQPFYCLFYGTSNTVLQLCINLLRMLFILQYWHSRRLSSAFDKGPWRQQTHHQHSAKIILQHIQPKLA